MKKSQVLVPGQATKQTPLQLSETSSWCMYGQGFAPASSWQDFQQTLGQAKDRVTSAVLATVTRARRAARYVEIKLGNGTLSAQRHPRHASTVPAYSIKYLVTGRNASGACNNGKLVQWPNAIKFALLGRMRPLLARVPVIHADFVQSGQPGLMPLLVSSCRVSDGDGCGRQQ